MRFDPAGPGEAGQGVTQSGGRRWHRDLHHHGVERRFGATCAPGPKVGDVDPLIGQQRGDRPALDESMGNFEALNEPHYVDYIQTDVGALFEEAGLKPQGKWMSSTSKTLSFTKPLSS